MKAFYVASAGAYLRFVEFIGTEPVRVFIHGWGAAPTADYHHIATHPGWRDAASCWSIYSVSASATVPRTSDTALKTTLEPWPTCWMGWEFDSVS